MKRLGLPILVLSILFVFTGCGEDYDNSELRQQVNSIENRVSKLENLCNSINSDIVSLQTIVSALQDNDYVTGIATITESDNRSGYVITFAKSEQVTIYNGKDGADGEDGKDGFTPVIGVRQNAYGLWYWTINGEWLLNNGEKVKATGTDGMDGRDGTDGNGGVTPQLKIEDGYWYIS